MNKDYWSYTLIIIVIVSVILTVYNSATLVKADSIERGSDIQIGAMYQLDSDDPFEEPIIVKVIDVQLNREGVYYVKYMFTSSNDTTAFMSKTEKSFKLLFTISND